MLGGDRCQASSTFYFSVSGCSSQFWWQMSSYSKTVSLGNISQNTFLLVVTSVHIVPSAQCRGVFRPTSGRLLRGAEEEQEVPALSNRSRSLAWLGLSWHWSFTLLPTYNRHRLTHRETLLTPTLLLWLQTPGVASCTSTASRPSSH